MYCVKTIVSEDGMQFEVNRMHSVDNFEPLKTFNNQKEAHEYVVKLIEEYKSTLFQSASN